MENVNLNKLFNLAISGTITPQGRQELFVLMADPKNTIQVETLLASAWNSSGIKKDGFLFTSRDKDVMFSRILEKENFIPQHRLKVAKNRKIWLKTLVAASIFMILGLSLYFYTQHKSIEKPMPKAVQVKNHILPGTEKAILTLGNGKKLELDQAKQGLLAKEPGVNINKLSDGQISYQVEDSAKDEKKLTYNSIAIPRGGHYKITLPDGTKVHLNSESVLRYPAKFDPNQRIVELVGEAYFDVTHQKNQPFFVKTSNQVIKVLGTIFNINAYPAEPIVKTTLISGSIKVTGKHGKTIMVKPGQTAFNQGTEITLKAAAIDEVLAWHNGYFIFVNEDIKSVMQKVARWYDIDVTYIGYTPDKKFEGVFQRSKSILQLLRSFKQTGLIDFKIKERRVIVIDKPVTNK